MTYRFTKDEAAMVAYGAQLSTKLLPGDIVYLSGDLGVGKTTFVKGILQGLGYTGAVTSPTYTLVEPYQITATKIWHLDLYRLQNAQELEFIGIRDMVSDESICLIEWPDKGQGYIPPATKTITFRYCNGKMQTAREVSVKTQ